MGENIFEKAAEVLMKRGHCKRALKNLRGEVCAIGSLAEVGGGGSKRTKDAADRAANLLGQRMGLGDLQDIPGAQYLHPLARWNDWPETTAEDVILLFKELGAEGR